MFLRITVATHADRDNEYVYFGYNEADNEAIEKILTGAGKAWDVLTEADLVNDGTESNTIKDAVMNRAESIYRECERIADLDGAISWYWPK